MQGTHNRGKAGVFARRIQAVVFCLSLVPAAAFAKTAKSSDKKDNASGAMASWMNKWPDGTSSGADLMSSGGTYTVTGTSKKMSYGNVHKRMNLDIDKTPLLSIDVLSASGFWFLVAKSPRIKQGYVKIQPDTNTTGKHIYNLQSITGLSGRQDLELELGVSSGQQSPNSGKSMTFKEFRFAASEPDSIPGAMRQTGWKDKWPDGSSTGASARETDDGFTVGGASRNQSYGSVYRIVSVNLDSTPFLTITPTTVNGYWYLEALGGSVKQPVKIQPDTVLQEAQSYDLRELLGLSGEQSFELHVGISTAGQEDSNVGKNVTFKGLSFTAKAEMVSGASQ